ncbi:MAG: hypothetical protein C4320_01425 [Armatimonadota bacterium]
MDGALLDANLSGDSSGPIAVALDVTRPSNIAAHGATIKLHVGLKVDDEIGSFPRFDPAHTNFAVQGLAPRLPRGVEGFLGQGPLGLTFWLEENGDFDLVADEERLHVGQGLAFSPRTSGGGRVIELLLHQWVDARAVASPGKTGKSEGDQRQREKSKKSPRIHEAPQGLFHRIRRG